MAQQRLRVVPPSEKTPRAKPKPKTLVTAAELSERELLVTMRTKIAAEIDGGVPAHALGRLIRELRDVDKDIRLLDVKANHEAEDSADDGGDESWSPSSS